jgi:hypothetical protein
VNKGGEVIGSGLSFEKDPVKLGYFRRSALRQSVAAIGGSRHGMAESAAQYLPSLLLSAQRDAICQRP